VFVPRPALDQAEGSGSATPAPPALALRTTPGHLIRRAQQVHTSLWSVELDGNLTGPQYALLSALSRTGGLDQGAAGRMASLDKSTAADVVARLERNGWIRRDRDPADGRRNTLMLSQVARAALRGITSQVQTVQQRLLEPLEAARQVRFTELLATVSYAGAPVPERTSDESLALGLGTTPGHLLRRAEQVHGTLWVSHVGDIATPAQYALLSALAWRPDTDQRAAGGMASLDKSSAADVVARLIRRGWIMSTQDPTDRRRKRLELSPSALRMLAGVTPVVRSVQDDLLRPLRSDDRAELVELLHDVAYRSDRPTGSAHSR